MTVTQYNRYELVSALEDTIGERYCPLCGWESLTRDDALRLYTSLKPYYKHLLLDNLGEY